MNCNYISEALTREQVKEYCSQFQEGDKVTIIEDKITGEGYTGTRKVTDRIKAVVIKRYPVYMLVERSYGIREGYGYNVIAASKNIEKGWDEK